MNILPMRYFMEVVKEQSISRASKKLYITQQTLSAHIASMEKELNCVFFQRKPSFQLTLEGEIFYEYCKKIVELDDAMHKEFDELASMPTGVFRIGISQTRSRILMPGVFQEFHKRFPRVMLQLVESTNEQLVLNLLENKVDVVIGLIPEDALELHVKELYKEKMVLLVPKHENYRDFDMEKLGAYSFVMNTPNDIAGRYAQQFFADKKIVPKIAAMSDSAETCIEMCRQGLGLYICPDIYVKLANQYEERFDILEIGMSYHIQGAYRKNSYISKLIAEFFANVQKVTDGFVK